MRTARRFESIKHLVFVSVAAAAVALAGPALGAPEKKMTDQNITDAIEDELLFDQAVPYTRIDIETDAGVVTLSGSVESLQAKDRAGTLAETVKGVRAVVNRIEVQPTDARSDAAVRSDVESALLADPATESYEIDTTVDDGTVFLSGTVDSWQEKELASTVAKGVRGVKAVRNNITIEYETKRPDAEIEPEVEKALRWDTLVDHALIDVKVSGGKVTLSGTVGSSAEKSRAITDAWVAGVKNVDASRLKVARWARDKDLRKDKYVVKSDQAIETAVNDALLYDPRVLGFNVTAEAAGGIVTLRGTVDNLKAKRAAAKDARNVVGVLGVRNRIKVRMDEAPTDAEIADEIRDALARDPYVEGFEITVSVIDGVAHLYGVVDTYFEKGQADDLASRTAGVIGVNNHLVVEDTEEPLAYEPYADEYYPYDYDWYDYEPNYTFLADARIAEEIRDEMWWSPFVDSDDVTVSVDDGVATLTGRVDSYSELNAATENAYEGGATWVDNDLELR